MVSSATTRAVVFATLHVPSTIILMGMLENSGLVFTLEKSIWTETQYRNYKKLVQGESIENTIKWLDETKVKYKNTYPIITPRFTPSCTDELMESLGKITKEEKLPVQSTLI